MILPSAYVTPHGTPHTCIVPEVVRGPEIIVNKNYKFRNLTTFNGFWTTGASFHPCQLCWAPQAPPTHARGHIPRAAEVVGGNWDVAARSIERYEIARIPHNKDSRAAQEEKHRAVLAAGSQPCTCAKGPWGEHGLGLACHVDVRGRGVARDHRSQAHTVLRRPRGSSRSGFGG